MSGAEVVAVLGIISSVIAIVDGVKQVYDAASNAAGLPEAFREVIGRLPIVRRILQVAKQRICNGITGIQSNLAIRSIIDACERKAQNLELIFRKVILGDDASRLERYFRAARTLGKGGRVKTLMEGLMKDVLLLAIAHGMQSATSQELGELQKATKDLLTLEPSISEAVLNFDSTNNNFGNGPVANNTNVENSRFQANYGPGNQFLAGTQTSHMDHEHIVEQRYHAQVQQFISTHGAPTQELLEKMCEERIFSELRFDGMDERYEDIADAYRKTFQWIYEKPNLNFVRWLNGGHGVYWISSKAGSGKSTLMKFLCQDRRTRDYLPGDIENILISSFFFHDSGDVRLLKTQEGLFRAVLHSILSKYRQLVRLQICLLIDGLDEFSGQHQDIIDILENLLPRGQNPSVRVQLCLSSRPLIVFEKAYLQHMHLRVQDLTADDIRFYVNTKFNDVPQLKDLRAMDPTTTNDMIQEILQKAEGVFLWVTLVTKSLIQSLDNAEDMKTLQRRLSFLPAGLVPLYKRMINQIDSFYRKEAIRIFHMVQSSALPLSPLAMSFSDDSHRDAVSHIDIYADAEIERRHSDVAKRMKARTADLIEICPVKHDRREQIMGDAGTHALGGSYNIPWVPSRLQYLHLTVKEFLLSDNVPDWLVGDTNATRGNTHLTIAACCLRQLRATGSPDMYDYHARVGETSLHPDYCQTTTKGIVFMIMFHLFEAERATKASKLTYLKSMNNFLMDRSPEITDRFPHASVIRTREHWHWTLSRYDSWYEPDEWRSDYVAYLITIGMTRSAIDIFNHGYAPAEKPGRPLLLYATCSLAPDYAIGTLERDKLDPLLVEELLRRNCNPNQLFDSQDAHSIRDYGARTVWEAVLVHVPQRFGKRWAGTVEASRHNHDLEEDPEGLDELRVRWLKVIKLFLDYHADLNKFVVQYGYIGPQNRRRRVAFHKKSALLVFKRVFAGFDNPLVTSIRNSMTANGATESEEDIPHEGQKLYSVYRRYRHGEGRYSVLVSQQSNGGRHKSSNSIPSSIIPHRPNYELSSENSRLRPREGGPSVVVSHEPNSGQNLSSNGISSSTSPSRPTLVQLTTGWPDSDSKRNRGERAEHYYYYR